MDGVSHKIDTSRSRPAASNRLSITQTTFADELTQSDSSVRRRAKLQRLQQVPKALDLVILELEHFTQDVFLQLRIVDSDGSAADLHAVQDEIVVLSPDLLSG